MIFYILFVVWHWARQPETKLYVKQSHNLWLNLIRDRHRHTLSWYLNDAGTHHVIKQKSTQHGIRILLCFLVYFSLLYTHTQYAITIAIKMHRWIYQSLIVVVVVYQLDLRCMYIHSLIGQRVVHVFVTNYNLCNVFNVYITEII